MATRYIVSESNALIAGLTTNLNQAEGIFEALKRATDTLSTALTNGELQGKTYESADHYFMNVLLPLMEKGKQIVDKAKEDLGKYQYENGKISHYGDIDISQLRGIKRTKQNQLRVAQNFQYTVKDTSVMTPALEQTCRVCRDVEEQMRKDIKKIDEKIQALDDFERNTNVLFQDGVATLTIFGNAIEGLQDIKIAHNGEVTIPWSVQGNMEALKNIDKEPHDIDWEQSYKDLSTMERFINPMQIHAFGGKIKAGTKGIFGFIQDNRAIKSLYQRDPSKLKGSILGKANFKDFKVSKLFKSDSKTAKYIDKNIVSKFPSFKNGGLKTNLSEAQKGLRWANTMGKVGTGLKVAGSIGTGLGALGSFSELKSKGFSNEQATAVTARRTAVGVASSKAGTVAGAHLGSLIGSILPGAVTAVGAVVGGFLGGIAGGFLGSLANKELDKGVKPKKKGWSWPW